MDGSLTPASRAACASEVDSRFRGYPWLGLIVAMFAGGTLLCYSRLLGGFYLATFDDVGRVLLAGDLASHSAGLVVDRVWLPLTKILLAGWLLIFPNLRVTPSIWNLFLSLLTLVGVFEIARRLSPRRPAFALFAPVAVMANPYFARASVSGLSEPLFWCLMSWFFVAFLDALSGRGVMAVVWSGAALAAASWTRMEAWLFIPSLFLAVSRRDAARAAVVGTVAAAAAAAFLVIHHCFYGEWFWKIEIVAQQHYGWRSMKLYPVEFLRQTGIVFGIFGALWAARSDRMAARYVAVVAGALAAFTLSAWVCGIGVIYQRYVTTFAVLAAPPMAAGFGAFAARWEGRLPVETAVRWTCIAAALVAVLLLPGAFARWPSGLAATRPFVAALIEAAQAPSGERQNVLAGLDPGEAQDSVHAFLLLELLVRPRRLVLDRHKRYEVLQPGDRMRLITDGNASLFDDKNLREILDNERIGRIVLIDSVEAERVRGQTGWSMRRLERFWILEPAAS